MTTSSRIVATALLVLTLAACGGAASESAAPAPAAAATDSKPAEDSSAKVKVINIAFKPGDMKVLQGTEVTWVNEDKDVHHTVTSGEGGDNGVPGVSDPKPNAPDGEFDGDLPKAGDEFAFTFDEAGEYAYFCEVHPSMRGTIVVE